MCKPKALPEFAQTRRWWPAALVDEVMPPGRASPQMWLEPDIRGITVICDDGDDEPILCSLLPGETVEFCWWEDRGDLDVTMMPDGTWKLDDMRDDRTIDMFRPHDPPQRRETSTLPMARVEASNWFAWEEDYETCCDTMDQFVRCMVDMEPPEPEGTRIVVDMGFWSERVLFRVSADGKTLEPVHG